MKRIALSGWLVVLGVVFSQCRAEVGPQVSRKSVKIVIMPNGGGDPKITPVLLRNLLSEKRFTADVTDKKVKPEDWFQDHKDTHHVIEIIGQHLSVYTAGKSSVEIHGIDHTGNNAELVRSIDRYLTLPRMIEARLERMPEQSHFLEGYRLLSAKKYTEARDKFLDEKKRDATNPDLIYNLALCYRRLGDPRQQQEVEKGLYYDGDHTALWNLKALLKLDNDEADEAIAILEKITKQEQEEPIFLWNLALAYANNGELKKAQECYAKIQSTHTEWATEAKREAEELRKRIEIKEATIKSQKEIISSNETKLQVTNATINDQNKQLAQVGTSFNIIWWILIGTALVTLGYLTFSGKLGKLFSSATSTPERVGYLVQFSLALLGILGTALIELIKSGK